jgi:hypothetical protein
MKKLFTILLLALVGVTGAFGIYTTEEVTDEGKTNLVIHLYDTTTEFNVYWETGNYTSNIVARLVKEDIASVAHNLTRVDTNNLNRTTERWITRKYFWSMTNRVHWLKSHVSTTNDPYIVATLWHEWGYANLYWSESLTEPNWIQVVDGHNRFDPRVACKVKIHMHPDSEATKKMLTAKTGFFCQNRGGPYVFVDNSYGRNSTRVHEKLFKVDMSNFFPEPEPPDIVPSRAMMGLDPVVSSSPPPVPNGTPVETYWLNTSSGTRHNSDCRYYENTKQGVACNEDDGTACGTCGG